MAEVLGGTASNLQKTVHSLDKAALEAQDEAIEVATQRAQEKIDNFLLDVE